MAATTKTLTPTNQTISIPAFTDKPDNRLQMDSTGKLADAVNALSEQITNFLDPHRDDDYTGDFNDMPAGFCYTNTTTNAPSTGGYYFVITMRYKDRHATQIAISRASTPSLYYRGMNSNTWSPWFTVGTVGNQ